MGLLEEAGTVNAIISPFLNEQSHLMVNSIISNVKISNSSGRSGNTRKLSMYQQESELLAGRKLS